jgi:hypothetical protein
MSVSGAESGDFRVKPVIGSIPKAPGSAGGYLLDRDDLLTQIVARKVVEVAGTGERDPERLRDLVLLALKGSDRRTA